MYPSTYTSEFMIFLNDFLEKHPEVSEDKVKAYQQWWATDVNTAEEKAGFIAADIPAKAYTYQSE